MGSRERMRDSKFRECERDGEKVLRCLSGELLVMMESGRGYFLVNTKKGNI